VSRPVVDKNIHLVQTNSNFNKCKIRKQFRYLYFKFVIKIINMREISNTLAFHSIAGQKHHADDELRIELPGLSLSFDKLLQKSLSPTYIIGELGRVIQNYTF
jgi:hypothetical protein